MRAVFNNSDINILHFCGKSRNAFKKTMANVFFNAELNPLDESKITLLSCWTDREKCILKYQLEKFGITLHNCVPFDYDLNSEWKMLNKIKFILDYLINNTVTDLVMILDCYDVLFVNTDNIIEKFLSQPYRILYNATSNNFPDEYIDTISNRDSLGQTKYFNAGCCIGYKNDLISFYKKALKYMDIDNPLNSEQKILRHVFGEYSIDDNQKFVMIDYNSLIFRVMPQSKVNWVSKDMTLYISNSLEK